MPSYLGAYKTAASNRREKLIRAIDSVVNQSFDSWELLILADGCRETFDLVCSRYLNDNRIQCWLVQKQPMFSPFNRNYPLTQARGQYTVYLDSDDFFGTDHLTNIHKQITGSGWYFFNDLIPSGKGFKERRCQLFRGQCGTANIAHPVNTPVRWRVSDYGKDDWTFITDLESQYGEPAKIDGAQYHVCHIPRLFDV